MFDTMFSPFEYEFTSVREAAIEKAANEEVELLEEAIDTVTSRFHAFIHAGGSGEVKERLSYVRPDVEANVKQFLDTTPEVMSAVLSALRNADFPPAKGKGGETPNNNSGNGKFPYDQNGDGQTDDNTSALDWQVTQDQYGEFLQAQTQDGTVYSVFPYENGFQWIVNTEAGVLAQGESATLDDAKLDAESSSTGDDPNAAQKPVNNTHDNPGATPPRNANAHDVDVLDPNIERIDKGADEDNPGSTFPWA